MKCGEKGHFKAKCPKANRGWQENRGGRCRGRGYGNRGSGSGYSRNSNQNAKQTNYVSTKEMQGKEAQEIIDIAYNHDDYVFSISALHQNNGTYALNIGVVELPGILLDSGAGRNVMSQNMSEFIKTHKVKCGIEEKLSNTVCIRRSPVRHSRNI